MSVCFGGFFLWCGVGAVFLFGFVVSPQGHVHEV